MRISTTPLILSNIIASEVHAMTKSFSYVFNISRAEKMLKMYVDRQWITNLLIDNIIQHSIEV